MAIAGSRTTLRFDEGWLFYQGDVPAPVANKHLAAYMANKAGYAAGAARGNYDDSDWQPVTLPHDWSVDGPFSPDHHVNSGFLPRGVGWYRRHFRLDESARGKVVRVRFDGIASHAQVFVNGHLLTRSFNGYLPVDADLTDIATYGDALNVIAVRVDATPMEGWWYEGAGLYRHAWLTKQSAFHIAPDGLHVRPERAPDGTWRVPVTTRFGRAAGEQIADCRVVIRDPAGRTVVENSRHAIAAAGSDGAQICVPCVIEQAVLWDVDAPNLYTAEVELVRDGVRIDHVAIRFGLRTFAFDARAGFTLNGRHLLLKGVCLHQDHAGVGVAVPDSLQRFRVQRLKDMGCNAVRVGHHPPAPEFLDACDELGLLVMDENRSFGSTPEHLSQLRAMVLRDFNHPSVILWSICNEEAIQSTPAARSIAASMVREVKRLDTTRPVTAAISGGILNDNAMSETIDVMSINYSFATLDPFHAKWPNRPVLSSETGCTLSTRGVYKTDPAKFHFASYDEDFERWGSSAREAWRQISSRPWMAGLFVWTGFDYRGEPSPHTWPSTTSHWGILDLCGFEKDAFWRHRAWFVSEPVLHLLPHWNWLTGETVRVQAVTNCDEVELFLNGRSLGREAGDPPEWHVPFEPGELKAVAYRGGRVVATAVRETTGPAVGLGVELHASCDTPYAADGEAAWPFTVFAIDAAGRRVPTADAPLEIAVDGPAGLIGVGNGDPNGQFANRGPCLPLFNGLAQAIVRAGDTAGRVTVRATSAGLADGVLAFDTHAAPKRPTVPLARRRWFVTDWLMGPIAPTPPDAATSVAGTDMNTWERVQAGGPQSAWSTAVGYALYRATLKPPKAMADRGGRLVFERVDGGAEVFVDGVPVASGSGRIDVSLTARSTPADVVIRLSGKDGAGINGPVELVVDARLPAGPL